MPDSNSKASLTPAALLSLLTNLPVGSKLELEILESGAVAVSEDTRKTKEQLIEEKYAHLKGVGITLSEAAARYDVPRGIIQNWVYRSNDVSFVDEASYPKLVSEAEIALCAEIHHRRKEAGIPSIPFFDEDGFYVEDVKHPHRSRRLKQAA